MIILLILTQFLAAQAGVFNIPRYVDPGFSAIGAEVDLTLADENAGLAGNLRFTQGINDFLNLGVIVGTGGGDRRFRVGAIGVFDLFPDADDQVGVGLGTSVIYYRLRADRDSLQTVAYPYIHKSFATGGGEIDPFLSIPFGYDINDGDDHLLWWLAVGAAFKRGEHFHFFFEIGAPIERTDTYISGGVAYYN